MLQKPGFKKYNVNLKTRYSGQVVVLMSLSNYLIGRLIMGRYHNLRITGVIL